jgi:hypothetical protein
MSVFICGTFERCHGAGQRRCSHDRLLANVESLDHGSVTRVFHTAEIVQ